MDVWAKRHFDRIAKITLSHSLEALDRIVSREFNGLALTIHASKVRAASTKTTAFVWVNRKPTLDSFSHKKAPHIRFLPGKTDFKSV